MESPGNTSKDFAVFGNPFPFYFTFFTPLCIFNENNEIQPPISFFHCRSLCFSENVCIMEFFNLILYHLKIFPVFLHFLPHSFLACVSTAFLSIRSQLFTWNVSVHFFLLSRGLCSDDNSVCFLHIWFSSFY